MTLTDSLLVKTSRPYADGRFPTNMSWWSYFSFSWVTPLMQAGYRRPLVESDVFGVPGSDENARLTRELSSNWESCQPSLFKALRRMWLIPTIQAGLWKTLNDGSQFAGPVLMSQILKHLTEFSASNLLILALCMYVSQIVGALGEAQYFQTGMRVGMQLRSALMALIFQKSLRTHSSTNPGKLTNMLSSDTESLQSFCEVMHVLWSAPLRIVTSMVLLYYLLGSAAVCGAAVLVGAIPVQKFLVSKMTQQVKAAQLHTDERLKLVGESIGGIQVVKCYAWERAFRDRVFSVRENELSQLYNYALIRAFNSFLISAIPVLVAVVSFAAYSIIPTNPPLTAVQAFTALSLFQVLRFPLMQLPSVINSLGACRVSIDRISSFLAEPEHAPASGDHQGLYLGEMKEAKFKHLSGGPYELSVPELRLAEGQLYVVVGATASGKSSLLQALLGQMTVTAGAAVIPQRPVAYCPQTPWIFSSSVRENVLFGSTDSFVDEQRLSTALTAVQFVLDLGNMPDGDRTELGERGINLSGGQKHRLSLARAVYSKSPLVLLDDPLSALDATVAAEVYREAIVGAMAGRTRVLVTNRLEAVLPSVDAVKPLFIVVADGEVVGTGRFSDLISKNDEFKKIVSRVAISGDGTGKVSVVPGKTKTARSLSVERSEGETKKIIQKEDRQTGAVATSTVKTYLKAMRLFWLVLSLYALTELFRVLASVWLSEWSSSGSQSTLWFLGVYVSLSGVQLLLLLGSQLVSATSGQRAARELHARMFDRLIVAPMKFFHSTPLGRILNRFSKDVGDTDKNLAVMLGMTLSVYLGFLGTVVVLAFTAVWTVIAFVPLLVAFYYLQGYYRASSREIKRMDAISRSPIYAHFTQVQTGIDTVLAFGQSERVVNENSRLIDNHIRFNLAQMSTNRWLGIRLEFYGGALVLVTALFVVVVRDTMAVGIAGLALSTALQVTGALGGIVRLSAMLENSMNSVERIVEYSAVPSENLLGDSAVIPSAQWPRSGAIVYSQVSAAYGDSPVLNGLDLKIIGGQKVGVIGRTGAGKTSLVMTLFRILEVSAGTITIDGIDTRKIPLKTLRAAIGIIPQEPMVFEGTLRDNVDPFHEFSDEQVDAALRASHLVSVPMTYAMTHEGKNLSAGQRQQVCLARVILRKPKILVLDEATSSLDAVTDNLVLATIREQFSHATVITVAHRLHTIIDSDVIIALDSGRVGEIGSPQELVENPDGLFASLIRETGPATSQYLCEQIRSRHKL